MAHHRTVGDPLAGAEGAPQPAGSAPIHPLLAAVFAAFEAAGVRWCLLRGEAGLAEPAGDVDLLVAREDRDTLRTCAIETGFLPLTTWGRGSHRFFIGYHAPTDAWVKLDVVSDLRFGPDRSLELPGASRCLDRRKEVGDLFVLAPEDAFWALLLHGLLDEHASETPDRVQLETFAGTSVEESPLARGVARASSRMDVEGLIRDVRSTAWDRVRAAGPRLRHGLAHRHPVRSRWRAAMNPVFRKTTRLLLLRSRGMMVAVIGPDGAGKSSLARDLVGRFVFPVVPVYMGMHRDATVALGRGAPLPLPFRIGLQWIRYLRATVDRARGRLVIFDRYTYDARLPPRHSQPLIRRWARQVLARSLPAPDLALLLDAPAEILHARKAELPIEVQDGLRTGYMRLATADRRIRVVDGTAPREDVRREATRLVWNAYLARVRPGRQPPSEHNR